MKKTIFKKRSIGLAMLLAVSIPLLTNAASEPGVSGLAVAQYKLEGAEQKGWTNMPISTTSSNNTFNYIVKTPGTTVITAYVEDKAGNKDYQIKTVTLDGDNQDAGFSHITYRLTGATEREWTTYSTPITITSEGKTTIQARIYDLAGNYTETQQDIRLDKTAPVNSKATITLE